MSEEEKDQPRQDTRPSQPVQAGVGAGPSTAASPDDVSPDDLAPDADEPGDDTPEELADVDETSDPEPDNVDEKG